MARPERPDLCNMLVIVYLPVVGPFIIDPAGDQHGERHAYCQATDIDERGKPVFEKTAPGSFKIIFKHALWVYPFVGIHLTLNGNRKCYITE